MASVVPCCHVGGHLAFQAYPMKLRQNREEPVKYMLLVFFFTNYRRADRLRIFSQIGCRQMFRFVMKKGVCHA